MLVMKTNYMLKISIWKRDDLYWKISIAIMAHVAIHDIEMKEIRAD